MDDVWSVLTDEDMEEIVDTRSDLVEHAEIQPSGRRWSAWSASAATHRRATFREAHHALERARSQGLPRAPMTAAL